MSVAEIARIAGVSVATVSRVLNNHPRVRPETVQQVKRVLNDMGYVRPTIRRGPRLGRRNGPTTGSIAVLALGDPGHARFRLPLFANVLSGIVRAAREQELNTLVDTVGGPHELCPAVRDGEVDGAMVVASPLYEPFLSSIQALRQQMPVVRIMGDALGLIDFDHIGPDHLTVGYMAHAYLMEKGCRHTAFVSTTPAREVIRSRAMGFTSAAMQSGAPLPKCYIIPCEEADAHFDGDNVVACDSVEELARKLATATPRPSGVFIARDGDTVQVQPLLQQLGVSIGDEMTIISCDNDDVRLSMLSPRPASIDLCAEEIGRRGLNRLVGRIRKPDEHPVRILIVPRIALPPQPSQRTQMAHEG
jgi:DNA-binding LacI/PurR family transcriptional regulator